jgi:hypothetical protein
VQPNRAHRASVRHWDKQQPPLCRKGADSQSRIDGLISSPSSPPRPKLEAVFFSIGEANLADNDAFSFLENKFRHIHTKAFGRFDLVTLLSKLRYRLIEIFNRRLLLLRVSGRSRHSQDGYRSSRFPHHTLLRSAEAATAPPIRPLPIVPAVALGRHPAPTARA